MIMDKTILGVILGLGIGLAIIVPILGSSVSALFESQNDCTASFIVPAFADGHYENFKFYNSVVHATDSPILNDQDPTDAYLHGIQNASYTGRNVTQISVYIGRYVDVSQPTGNIVIGIFDNNNPTYTIRQAFANIDVSTLTEYPTFQNYKANFTSGYVMQAGDIIGIEVNAGAVGERSGLVDRVDDTINDVSVFVLNDNTEYNHGGFAGNGNLFGYVSESIFVADIEEQDSNAHNREILCNSSFSLLAFGMISALIGLLIGFIYMKGKSVQ